ncbi:MAG: DNA polymerase III subunit delta' [Candidatus Hydrogenedentota bacterium]
MALKDVRDQDIPIRLLSNLITRSRIPNGLLFWGASGVGKSMTAIAFAKAINCNESPDDSCGTCLSCRKIDNGNHPDIIEVAPVKKARIIDVEAIENMIEMASLRPYEADWRIFIIHEADRMRGPAQNRLLKTLEEPLGPSVFILVSEYPQLLLPTIRSRCQRIRFRSLHPDTVKDLVLRERDIAPDLAEAITGIAQGQMSRALDLVDSDKRAMIFEIIEQFQRGEDPLFVAEEFASYVSTQKAAIEGYVKSEAPSVDVKEVSKEDRERMKEEQMALVDALSRRNILEFLYLLEMWYRDVMVYGATGDASQVLNKDQLSLLEQANTDDPQAKIGAIEKARLYLERFLNEERVFRDLFFVLAR